MRVAYLGAAHVEGVDAAAVDHQVQGRGALGAPRARKPAIDKATKGEEEEAK